MSFSKLQLAPAILKAVTNCGYKQPTPVQAEAIPPALEGRDVIASAQTGTGKTAAFVLPALQRLLQCGTKSRKGPSVLVLTPTRELAEQITQATRTYGRHLPFKSATIVGGMPYRDQFKALGQKPDLLIATPGRLLDHMERGSVDLSSVHLLVLDEADRMLDMGFIDDVEKIAAAVPGKRQTLMFAATLDMKVTKLAAHLLKEPLLIQIEAQQATNINIEQRLHMVDDIQHKNRMLQHLIEDSSMKQAIIFSATRRDADKLARELHAQGQLAAALHGDMKQGARNRTIKNLRCGRIRLLVATDVAARGLDVAGISHVINYDLPKFAEDYVHRIGRTGRAGATGIAISFASRQERSYLAKIEKYIGQTLCQQVIPGLEPKRPLQAPAGARGKRPNSAAPNRFDAAGAPEWASCKPRGRSGTGQNAHKSKHAGHPRRGASAKDGRLACQYWGGGNH